jgi:SAM-dependent methyltransferase
MNAQTHWEKIYAEKAPDAVSWYRPHLETSLELIERVAADRSSSVIDVGGGESTLVDDLLAGGYEDVTVLDISRTAIDANRTRLGEASELVHWLVADITQSDLPSCRYDVWHDRAVFHFLTAPADRVAYVRQVARTVKNGGHVIVGTFAPEGPTKCSGLEAFAMMPNRCTESLVSTSAYWGVPKNSIRRRLGRSSSFSIVTAGSNSAQPVQVPDTSASVVAL